MRIIILRFPNVAPALSHKICELAEKLEYDIEGIVSFDQNETLTSFRNYPVYKMMQIYDLSWDVAVYAYSDEDFETIRPRLIKLQMGTDDQFKNIEWLLKQVMIKKYEDFNDPIIQATLKWWKTHELSVYNQQLAQDTFDKVYFDETCNLPYINFKTIGNEIRKMYFPDNYNFFIYNDEKFVPNILREQLPNSPHLYMKGKHKINKGDIVIDAGVCEGNFALRYVDICSKMYLFEPEPMWQEPLNQTFKDYRDKVEIIPRFVSNTTGGGIITLDDALPDLKDENIFLKMDIEGAEPYALRGAKNLLTNNKVKASVCTYHNADDLIKVKSIFQKYGYKTSTSAGYATFYYSPSFWDTVDFRKAVVYAVN